MCVSNSYVILNIELLHNFIRFLCDEYKKKLALPVVVLGSLIVCIYSNGLCVHVQTF